MAREKEIRKEAIEITHFAQFGHSGRDMVVAYDAFILGAKWADKTMIDKVCEWLDKNITNYTSDMMGYIEYSQINDIIQDFRKAMEG